MNKHLALAALLAPIALHSSAPAATTAVAAAPPTAASPIDVAITNVVLPANLLHYSFDEQSKLTREERRARRAAELARLAALIKDDHLLWTLPDNMLTDLTSQRPKNNVQALERLTTLRERYRKHYEQKSAEILQEIAAFMGVDYNDLNTELSKGTAMVAEDADEQLPFMLSQETLVDPKSPIGVAVASALNACNASFIPCVLRNIEDNAIACSEGYIVISPSYAAALSQENMGEFLHTIAHEAQHILFKDAQQGLALQILFEHIQKEPDECPAYLKLIRLQEYRADTLASLTEPGYIKGRLERINAHWDQFPLSRNHPTIDHMPNAQRKALNDTLYKIIEAITPEEQTVIAAPAIAATAATPPTTASAATTATASTAAPK